MLDHIFPYLPYEKCWCWDILNPSLGTQPHLSPHKVASPVTAIFEAQWHNCPEVTSASENHQFLLKILSEHIYELIVVKIS